MLNAVTVSGKSIKLDISDKACLKFGFKHGDTIIIPNPVKDKEATVIGVASPLGDGINALWFTVKGDGGKVSYARYSTDLKGTGFKLKEKK